MTSFKLDADLRAAIVAEFGTQGMAAYLRRVVRADMEVRGRVASKALDTEREPIPMPVLVVEVRPPAPEPRKKRSARALGPYMSLHPAYTAWRSMRDKSRSSGIAIHPAWTDFWAFVRDMGPKPPGTVLKRHNSTQSWAPDNCIWATHREANHGRSVVPLFTIGDRTMALPDWATESVSRSSVGRLRRRSGCRSRPVLVRLSERRCEALFHTEGRNSPWYLPNPATENLAIRLSPRPSIFFGPLPTLRT